MLFTVSGDHLVLQDQAALVLETLAPLLGRARALRKLVRYHQAPVNPAGPAIRLIAKSAAAAGRRRPSRRRGETIPAAARVRGSGREKPRQVVRQGAAVG